MKLFICSDLHFEFQKDGGKSLVNSLNKDVDGIIIAGDLTTERDIISSLRMICSEYKNVYYVVGNHEFYYSDLGRVENALYKAKSLFNNLFWLENSNVIINNVKIIGCTLWFEPRADNFQYEFAMNDFSIIDGFSSWVYEKNRKSLEYLQENVDNNSIVITHHLPSNQCIDKMYKNSELNRFFVSPAAEKIIIEKSPKYWVFGHTHTPYSNSIGNTKLICNPFGYPRERCKFNENLIIEV